MDHGLTYEEARRIPVGKVYVRFGGSYAIVDERFDDGMRDVGLCVTCGHGVRAGKAARRCADDALVHTYDCRRAF